MSMSLDRVGRFLAGIALAILAVGGAGCASGDPNAASQYQFPGAGGTAGAGKGLSPGLSSMLQVGDMITVNFSDTPQPLQEIKTRIPEDGMMTLHYNIRVMAAGKTVPELEREIRAAFVPKLYKNLTAIVRAEERYYYVGGEVRSPNRYPLQGDMTVLRAIETAGGFTDFANHNRIELRRQSGETIKLSEKKIKADPALDLPVLANDHIRVKRRWF